MPAQPMHYRFPFSSKNDEDEHFKLTFDVLPSRRMPVVCDPQVYQYRGDMFCRVTSHIADKRTCLHVESIHNSMKFSIEIFVGPEGCELFVIEQVLTTIAHTNIKPV